MTQLIWDGQTIDPLLLVNYGYNDQITYRGYTLPRFLYYMLAAIHEVDREVEAAVLGMSFSLTATSTTAITVTAGVVELTIEPNKAFKPGMVVQVTKSGDHSVYMIGAATSYDIVTGALTIDVPAPQVSGAGEFGNWTVSLAGWRGPPGLTGAAGAAGPAGPPGSGASINVQEGGVNVTAAPRPFLSFAGDHVSVTDDPPNNRAVITIQVPKATENHHFNLIMGVI